MFLGKGDQQKWQTHDHHDKLHHCVMRLGWSYYDLNPPLWPVLLSQSWRENNLAQFSI
jgi:hypothetical protein